MNRLDIYLKETYPEYSRAQLQKYIQAGLVQVNGSVITTPRHSVGETDTIDFQAPPTAAEYPAPSQDIFEILYEDNDILVINKPVGMVVHPQDTEEKGSVVQAVLGMRPEIANALYDTESSISRLRPGIVHRLDKDTSGVMVIAKNRESLLKLAQQFHDHTTEKTYQTILFGTLKEARTIDAPIQRKGGGDKNKMGASHMSGAGRAAISHFTPLKSWQPYPAWPEETVTLAQITIETGRTHQIRVHAKFIGHPVMGDRLYGNKPSTKLSEKLGVSYQLLHAQKLCITHPTTNERMCFTAPLSPAIQAILPTFDSSQGEL